MPSPVTPDGACTPLPVSAMPFSDRMPCCPSSCSFDTSPASHSRTLRSLEQVLFSTHRGARSSVVVEDASTLSGGACQRSVQGAVHVGSGDGSNPRSVDLHAA